MLHAFIVEDDFDIQQSLIQALSREGFKSSAFSTGQKALEALKLADKDASLYHIALIDLTLPDMDGLDILRYLRGSATLKNLPCILVTARTEEIDRVIGLELGADDYISKPYSIRELSARVKALMRRTQIDPNDTAQLTLQCGPIRVDLSSRQVHINKKISTEFTRKEFELLVYLIENQGRVLSREKILQSVWGLDYLGESRTIDAHVKRVRSKLGAYGDLIETSIGVGYRMLKPDE